LAASSYCEPVEIIRAIQVKSGGRGKIVFTTQVQQQRDTFGAMSVPFLSHAVASKKSRSQI